VSPPKTLLSRAADLCRDGGRSEGSTRSTREQEGGGNRRAESGVGGAGAGAPAPAQGSTPAPALATPEVGHDRPVDLGADQERGDAQGVPLRPPLRLGHPAGVAKGECATGHALADELRGQARGLAGAEAVEPASMPTMRENVCDSMVPCVGDRRIRELHFFGHYERQNGFAADAGGREEEEKLRERQHRDRLPPAPASVFFY